MCVKAPESVAHILSGCGALELYESDDVQAYWGVLGFEDHEGVRCNRFDARIVNHKTKRVITLEMSCPWVKNRDRKSEEKTLRWELKQQFPGYEVNTPLWGWSRELDTTIYEIVGSRNKEVLQRM